MGHIFPNYLLNNLINFFATGGKKMDEYSPKRHDIAQLKFLCHNLYDASLETLNNSHHGWINDPTSAFNLQLNELIEHIANLTMSYKIKHLEDSVMIAKIDHYLDSTFMLFSSYGINAQELQCWQHLAETLFRFFDEECVNCFLHA